MKTQISKLIAYSLARYLLYIIKIAKLYVISLLILVSISIGNPPIYLQTTLLKFLSEVSKVWFVETSLKNSLLLNRK